MRTWQGRVAASLLVVPLSLVLAGCRHGGAAADSGEGEGGDEKGAKPVVQVALATVQRATVRATIPVTGTLAPLPNMEAKVAPLAAGRLRQVFVKTGDLVTTGQVIATLDPGPLLAQLQQAQATVHSDTASLQQARLNLEAQQRSQRAAVEQARTNLRTQQVALQKLQAGSRPQEIAQAQAAVTSAEAALTNAEQGLSRSQTLFAEGLMARKDLEAAQAQQRTAQAQLASAQEALSLVRQGNRPEDIEAGRVAVRLAEEQLRAAQEQAVQNAAKAEDVRIAERQLQGAQAAVRAAEAQLGAMTVRAPLSGTVTGRTLNPGETADVAAGVATIVNLDRIRVLLNVPAAQVAGVRPGQLVEFTVEAAPRVTHRAVVSVVNRAVDPNTDTVQVEAVADNRDRDLRDDGFVRGAIVTAARPGTLVVPSAAVVDKDGKPTVFVVGTDNVAHARAVETGLRDPVRVEVRGGVREGERVVTTGAYELEDGAEVKVAAAEKGGA